MQHKQINYLFWQRFISLLLIVYFSQPYLAELSFKQGKTEMLNLNIESAVRYFELARRLTPYNDKYFYTESTYWRLAAQNNSNNKQAALRADNLLVAGLEANPYAVKNLLSRALMHRDNPDMFNNPATKKEILAWFDYILYWRPAMEIAQYEYVNTLIMFEQREEAAIKLKAFLKINRKSDLLLGLKDVFDVNE